VDEAESRGTVEEKVETDNISSSAAPTDLGAVVSIG
jgi:hypothetical protein